MPLFIFYLGFILDVLSATFLNPFHFHEMGLEKQLTQTTQWVIQYLNLNKREFDMYFI